MPAAPGDAFEPIAPGDVLIHIGPPKTGSTSIQTVLAARRAELAELGVLYPGRGWRAKFESWAVMDTRRRGLRKAGLDEWDQLVAEVNASGLRAVVSSEAFARADESAVARTVESFGAARVHVVAVGRRLDHVLPSLYQEQVKKFLSLTYDEWLGVVLAGDDPGTLGRSFPAGQQLGAVAARWAARIAPERFHLICSAEGGRAVVPRSFERLLDLPEGFLEPTRSRNESLDRTSVEVLRRLNAQKPAHGWSDDFYRAMVFNGAVRNLRQLPRGAGSAVPPPPPWALDRIRVLAAEAIARLHDLGPHVIGDLESLRPGPVGGTPEQLPADPDPDPDVDPGPVLDIAVAALTGALDAAWRLETDRRKASGDAAAAPAPGSARRRNRK